MPSSLFSSKGKKPKDIKVIVINRFDREDFFRSLREFGWEQTEGPFEFELKWKHDRIRKSAREHAAEINGDILIEIRDKDYSTNPYNDYVYYIWKGTPGVRGIPPPPSYQHSTGFAVAQQMQMQQAQARAQHARAMKQMVVPPAPQAPPPQLVSSGGTCPKCNGNQVQYFNNSIARCPQCGSNFKWQMPPAQPPAPAPQQPVQRPPPQVQVPQQPPAAPQPQQPQQPAARPSTPAQAPVQQQQPQPQPQQPPRPQPQQPPRPQPQQAVGYCPKCRIPLTKKPDGTMVCTQCGLGQA